MRVTADDHRTRAAGDRPPGRLRADGAPGANPTAAENGRRPPPPGPGRRSEVFRVCTRLLADYCADPPPGSGEPPGLAGLHETAAGWMRNGGTADAFHRIVRSAVEESFTQILAATDPGSPGQLLPTVHRFVHAHERMSRAVSAGLMLPLGADACAPAPTLAALAAAAAEGRAEMLPPGARISDSYSVLALALRAGDDSRTAAYPEARPSLPNPAVPQALLRMRLVLARDHGPSVLAALGVHGGTVLVPADGDTDPGELITDLTAAAGMPILAIETTATRTQITAVAETAHELLDLAQRLQFGGGLYRFRDLALEYQLTRPSPARARLSARVAPLYEHPELLDTLLLYISNRLRRQATAHILELHRNTVDYRLRRIQELTGFDPVQQTGLWYLQSGLVAHGYESAGGGPIGI